MKENKEIVAEVRTAFDIIIDGDSIFTDES